MSPSRVRGLAVAAVCAAVAAASCSSAANSGAGDVGHAAAAASERELTVLAASSLTEAFTRIGRQFEAAHPGDVVRFSFGPSDGLAAQIEAGAPADVFASASETWMDSVQQSGSGVVDRSDFARNRLVIIAPPDNPAKIASLGDLGDEGVKLVLAAEGVPAGDYAREALKAVGVGAAAEANVVSNEQDDKSVVQKVLLGEADAGIVYRTDLTADVGSQVRAISIPNQANVVATYAIAIVAGRPSVATARVFVDFVGGPTGQRTLRAFHFLPP
jgi:molybdate transport system substrate-binding protein